MVQTVLFSPLSSGVASSLDCQPPLWSNKVSFKHFSKRPRRTFIVGYPLSVLQVAGRLRSSPGGWGKVAPPSWKVLLGPTGGRFLAEGGTLQTPTHTALWERCRCLARDNPSCGLATFESIHYLHTSAMVCIQVTRLTHSPARIRRAASFRESRFFSLSHLSCVHETIHSGALRHNSQGCLCVVSMYSVVPGRRIFKRVHTYTTHVRGDTRATITISRVIHHHHFETIAPATTDTASGASGGPLWSTSRGVDFDL
ncbi:unnamed protein product [Pleuronectes platessa]|uniref:Uncharacterized protein n=1 Tax=Pleuronectes platessa TaxID=8262 RepID=A0A9N7VYN7_PLEPL|nr:unnamed protein product [Pleuronectes platessa]